MRVNLVGELIVVDCWFGVHADGSETLRDALKASRVQGRGLARFTVALPEKRDLRGFGDQIVRILFPTADERSRVRTEHSWSPSDR